MSSSKPPVLNTRLLQCLIFLFLSGFFFNLLGTAPRSIIYLRHVDISTLDPGISSDHYSSEVMANIFEGLVRFKKNEQTLEPCLATGWERSDDGKRWVFTLRKGVFFHNGTPVNSQSVKFSFDIKFKKKKETYKRFNFLFSFISEIKIVDSNKIEFVLKKPYAPFLYSLANAGALIVAPASYGDKRFTPIGTGPFKFSKWTKDRFVILDRNNNYWEKKVRIEKIVFKVVEDISWRIAQLKSNKAHISIIRSGKEYSEIYGNKSFDTIQAPPIRIHYLAFNMRKSPFNRLEAREAVAHMINKKVLVAHTLAKMGNNATTPVPPQIQGFNPEIRDHEFNIRKASRLLKKAGITPGLKTYLYYVTGSLEMEEIANRLIRIGRKIGLTIKKVKLPFSKLREQLDKGKHHMTMMGWVGELPDADSYLYPTFTMESGNSNRAFYHKPELTSLLTMARESIEPTVRAAHYRRAQRIIKRDMPWIPLYYLHNLFTHNKKIKGLYVNYLSQLIFKDTYMEEN